MSWLPSLGMPSRDPWSGKRLSGAAQRKKQRTPASAEPHREVFARLLPPPVDEGVEACVAWLSDVGMLCMEAARDGAELVRVRVVVQSLTVLGVLKEKALRSEQAVRLRESSIQVLLQQTPPLGDAMAAVGWAYFQMMQLLYAQCQEEMKKEAHARWAAMTSSAARLGYVKEQAQTRALVQHLRRLQAQAASVDLTDVRTLDLPRH